MNEGPGNLHKKVEPVDPYEDYLLVSYPCKIHLFIFCALSSKQSIFWAKII